MSKVHAFFFLIFLFVSHIHVESRTIHIFGDSHASFCFRESLCLQDFESFELPVTINKRSSNTSCEEPDASNEKSLNIPFNVHWFGPITMHRVGRDALKFLNVEDFYVQEDDIAVFMFGEIDVRCHIGRQRDLRKRKIEEIIDILADRYIDAIKENQKKFKQLTCIVCCVPPPIDMVERNNLDYPFYGDLCDRVEIVRCLNKKLQMLCEINDLLFLDFYDLYANEQGSLDEYFADDTVHIDSIHNLQIKRKLIELVAPLFYYA